MFLPYSKKKTLNSIIGRITILVSHCFLIVVAFKIEIMSHKPANNIPMTRK